MAEPRLRRAASVAEAGSILAPSPPQPSLQDAISTAAQNSISTEELREYFECPVCYEVPRPSSRIFACSQGHMMCESCRPQLTTCPICRIAITPENQTRLYFAERLLEERVPVQCKFADFGCTVELVGNLMKQHEESGVCPFEPVKCDNKDNGCDEKVCRMKRLEHLTLCEFRLVDCPIENCKMQVVHKKLVQHIQRQHFGLFNSTENYGRLMILIFLISLIANIIFGYLIYF